ncbi:zf-HC2 domain-containing protein, partial [bacterium]|nr:zf-HC2 domain-containing protein [bacterium]
MDNIQHYSTEELVDYLEGRLDALTSVELSEHLESGCPTCNESMGIYKRMFSAIQTLHWKAPSPSAHRKVLQAYSAKYSAKPAKQWFQLLRPAFIGFAALMLIAFAFLFNLKPGIVYAGYVENVTGQVEMLDPATGSWREVKQGQSVPIKASIRSMTDSQAVIAYPGGEQTILGSESEIHLIALNKSLGSWEISLEQISGQTENLTAQKTNTFTIRTTAGVANSSNGHFTMQIKPDGSVVASVLAGEVETNSHSKKTIIHAGESTIMQSESTTGSPTVTNEKTFDPSSNPSPEPSLTATPTLDPTKTPKDIVKPTKTPTPQTAPDGLIPTSSSDN